MLRYGGDDAIDQLSKWGIPNEAIPQIKKEFEQFIKK